MSVYVDVRAWINPQALKLPWLPNADSTGTGRVILVVTITLA